MSRGNKITTACFSKHPHTCIRKIYNLTINMLGGNTHCPLSYLTCKHLIIILMLIAAACVAKCVRLSLVWFMVQLPYPHIRKTYNHTIDMSRGNSYCALSYLTCKHLIIIMMLISTACLSKVCEVILDGAHCAVPATLI